MRLTAILDILFPPVCLTCGLPAPAERPLCAACFARIPTQDALRCGECAARLPDGLRICHRDFPYLLGAAAPYADPSVQDLVRALKFRHISGAAVPLAELVAAFLKNAGISPRPETVIVPVPLGPRRLRTRGYNQAELIARSLAARFGLAVDAGNMYRVRNTPPQTELSARGRAANVAGAFGVRAPQALRGRPVWLVDDVTTSGATFLAAAQALKTAGARHILALAPARA
jgi:ComF family protein